ncbi:hypothetical protein L1887_10546 [Cichorium endivia]|nr:hypothetical protein L1887_22848 [Cichorium endivia]KAI3521087.1 hypothetical protein L1887_10546 [Cichorium endivia]
MTTGVVVISSESLNGEDGGISMESVMAKSMAVDVDLSDCNDGETVEVVGFVGVEDGYGDLVMIVSAPPVPFSSDDGEMVLTIGCDSTSIDIVQVEQKLLNATLVIPEIQESTSSNGIRKIIHTNIHQ